MDNEKLDFFPPLIDEETDNTLELTEIDQNDPSETEGIELTFDPDFDFYEVDGYVTHKLSLSSITCPLSHEIFFEPVIGPGGFTYERDLIEVWLEQKGKCPITHSKVKKWKLIPNISMKTLVNDVLENNPDLKDDVYLPLYRFEIVKNIMTEGNYNKLKNYKKYKLTKLFKRDQLRVLRKCDNDIIKHIIDHSNEYEKGTYKAIHNICKYTNPEIIKHLVEKGVNLESTTKSLKRPIHYVCINQDLEAFNILVEKGVDIHCKDKDGFQSIHYAAREGKVDILKRLIELGANINALNDEHCLTPLMLACRNDHIECINVLVNQTDINLSLEDVDQWYAIHFACKYSRPDAVRYLLDAGAPFELLKGNCFTKFFKEKKIDILELIRDNEIMNDLDKDIIINQLKSYDQVNDNMPLLR